MASNEADPKFVAECVERLKKVTGQDSVDEQKDLFQRAFPKEFAGRFRELDLLAEDFKAGCNSKGHLQEMGQFEALQFLTKRGEGKTARQLSDALKSMDYDKSGTLAFIEYLLFTFNKTVVDLFSNRPDDLLKVDLSVVDAAVAKENMLVAARHGRKAEMEALRAIVTAGGAGAAKAKLRLRQLELADPANQVKEEMDAIVGRLRAVKTLPRDQVSDEALAAKRQFEDERRLAEQQAEQESQRIAMEKQAAKERLFAKSSRFSGAGTNSSTNSSAAQEQELRRQQRTAEMAQMLGKAKQEYAPT